MRLRDGGGIVRLGRKNLLYSMALAGIMMLFLVGYFIYMLPSLYVEHVMEQNLKSIYEQHRAYMETGSYDDVRVRNSTACFSVEIPLEGNCMLVAGKAFSVEIILKDRRIAEILDSCRQKLEAGGILNKEETADDISAEGVGEPKVTDSLTDGKSKATDGLVDGEPEATDSLADGKSKVTGSLTDGEPEATDGLADGETAEWEAALADEMEALGEILKEAVSEADSFPVEIRLLSTNGIEEDFFNESMKVHTYSDNFVIMESSVEDAHNRYANYIAMEQTKDSIVLSCLPVVAPDVDEIRPVVLQSLPMLGAVIVLLVLLFSQMYSRGIVGPILRLARHAEEMEYAQDFAVGRMSEEWPDRRDEVRELADTLDDFYQQIKESYQKLEEKNRELEEENRRQEIFLRASSHQLKTPIAAALLLVEGMMNEIGRYRETRVYLPKVKEQLLSMRKMVEEILYLNHCAENRKMQQMDVGGLLAQRLKSYQVELADRGILTTVSGAESLSLYTDEMMITQILDNLLSNAVKYTPQDGYIEIELKEWNEKGKPEIRIKNSGTPIDGDMLPHIFEPFVTGGNEGASSLDSHGLGLYIASYYAKKLGITISVGNGKDCVIAALVFSE